MIEILAFCVVRKWVAGEEIWEAETQRRSFLSTLGASLERGLPQQWQGFSASHSVWFLIPGDPRVNFM